MSRSDSRLKIPSNINQSQTNELFKLKMGKFKFNNNGIAIIYKHVFLQDIIRGFFGIKYNQNSDSFEEKPVIHKPPFVLFKPIDSINNSQNKDFIFYYSLFYYTKFDESIININYTEEEFNNMSI